MCGISGKFGHIERDVFSDHLKDVSDLLSRRGPDQTNIIEIENFIAAHSRLIVQGDENDGIQPMRHKDIVLLFNGNLYNKESLKVNLKANGNFFS